MDVGAAEVPAAGLVGEDVDVEVEGGFGGVSGDEVDGVGATLHTDVDLLVLAEPAAGEVPSIRIPSGRWAEAGVTDSPAPGT